MYINIIPQAFLFKETYEMQNIIKKILIYHSNICAYLKFLLGKQSTFKLY